ncbi:MAG: hypothetical protein ACREYF_14195 [Gammaproteobacteria bacterium]
MRYSVFMSDAKTRPAKPTRPKDEVFSVGPILTVNPDTGERQELESVSGG